MATPMTISREKVEHTLRSSAPDHDDATRGYALVNVLPREEFEREHIPRSMNVPVGHLEQLEKRFEKSKPIIVYCASSECEASPKAAKELARMGFERVFDFEQGLKGWKEAGHGVASEAPSGR